MDLLPANAPSLKIYRQAKRILRTTTRSSDPDWYRSAGEINLQWHLWLGTHSGTSAIYSRTRKQWWAGPDVPPLSYETDENGSVVGLDQASRDSVHEMIRQILASREFGAKTKSLGIIIHLADGLRIRDLSPAFAADGDFDSVNELLISAPDIALEDESLKNSDGRWRILPLAGITEGDKRSVAVQVSSKISPLVGEFRNYGSLRNLPVVVEVRSALLESLAAVSYLHPEIQTPGLGSTLTLVQYESTTLLFAVGNRCDLQLVRTLMHRGSGHLTPSETQEVLTQTAALLNVKDPTVILVSTSGLGKERLEELLEPYRQQFPRAACHSYDTQSLPIAEGVPDGLFELATSVAESPPRPDEAPFQREFRERWARQNFFGPSRDEVALMPTRGDLRLLRMSGLLHKVAVVGILAFCGWTGMDFVTKMRTEAWKVSPDAAQTMEQELAKLQKEQVEWKHWDRLLAKRSEGWLALEALLEMFPANGGVVLKDASYRAEAGDSPAGENSLGIRRSWIISGYADPELASDLPNLGSRTRVTEMFNTIAERNESPYLAATPATRELQVTLQQKQGAMPPSPNFPVNMARHFRTLFELSIMLDVDSKDELAINIAPTAPQ